MISLETLIIVGHSAAQSGANASYFGWEDAAYRGLLQKLGQGHDRLDPRDGARNSCGNESEVIRERRRSGIKAAKARRSTTTESRRSIERVRAACAWGKPDGYCERAGPVADADLPADAPGS